MRKGFLWFAAILLAPALILYLTGAYELASYIYNTLLLAFALELVLLNRANIQPLGLTKGRWQTGLSLVAVVSALAFIVIWRRYGLSIPTLSIGLAFTVIYTPITEELFFRGYFQARLESRLGRWVGLIITATLFTIVHLPKVILTQLLAPIYLLLNFVLGIVFGVIRDESKSVYYPMLCHAAYNLATVFIA